jgi:hypothetical protein
MKFIYEKRLKGGFKCVKKLYSHNRLAVSSGYLDGKGVVIYAH